MLHPTDAFTGYTLDKGDWIINLPIALSPGWMWWGVTDWLTTELDWEAWLGGVPSFNFRFKLADQKGFRPVLAYETMFQYILLDTINLLDGYPQLDVLRFGPSWYNHLNASWQLSERFHLHLSAGVTYSGYLSIEDSSTGNSGIYENKLTPDLSLGLDWRTAPWVSLHSTGSYGSTFTYLDNVPRKIQWTAGTRFAPFYWCKWGFFRTFRIEVISLYMDFTEVSKPIWGPIGYVFWQF